VVTGSPSASAKFNDERLQAKWSPVRRPQAEVQRRVPAAEWIAMDMTGSQHIAAPLNKVWAALNDVEVLKQSIPGCQSIE